MSFRYITFIACVALLCSSCEKTIQVKVPEYPDRISIESNNTVDDLFRIVISKSVGITKYKGTDNLYLQNAKVDLYTNGSFSETLYLRPDEPATYSAQNSTPLIGNTYTLKVSSKGLPDAEATATVLPIVPIKSIRRIPNARNTYGPEDEVIITFDDMPNSEDYYMLSWNQGSGPQPIDNNSFCISTTDASIQADNIKNEEGIFDNQNNDGNKFCDNVLFNDELFNGTTKELHVFINSYFLEERYDQFGNIFRSSAVLMHISEDYYKYLKSSRYADINNGNPFAEPVNIHSNVTNGIGIFSFITYDSKEIE